VQDPVNVIAQPTTDVIQKTRPTPMTKRLEFVVYLSSTLADLEPERKLALETIGEFGVVKTSYRARTRPRIRSRTFKTCGLNYVFVSRKRPTSSTAFGRPNRSARST
jgi:hypothetical protein